MTVKLSDGTELLVRPISPSDKAMLAIGMTRLSQTTIQRRFLAPKPTLSAAELRYLTEVDGHDHYAIVAEHDELGIAAGARWTRLKSDPPAAGAAVVGADCMQNGGLGKQFAGMLGDAARLHGIRRIHA